MDDEQNDEDGEEINEDALKTDTETDREEESYSTEEEEEEKPLRRRRQQQPRGVKTKAPKVSCPTCSQKFGSQESFLTHMSNVHLKIPDFQCW